MNIAKLLKSSLLWREIPNYLEVSSSRINGKKILKCDFATMHPQIPRPLVFCGPSGSGKSTLIKRLLDDFPYQFGFTVSHTTRSPRPGEVHGKHYYFTDETAMRRAIENGEFIENAVFSGNMYGTSFQAVEDIARQGKIVLMDVDLQGVKQMKNTTLNPWCVFIQPPSLSELRKRLLKRKTESAESLERRLLRAREEMNLGLTPMFDKVIVNDDLDKAYRELKDFVEQKVLGLKKITTAMED